MITSKPLYVSYLICAGMLPHHKTCGQAIFDGPHNIVTVFMSPSECQWIVPGTES